MIMDIAAMSMQMHDVQLNQNVGIAMVKKTMEVQEASLENLVNMIPSDPSLGQNIDTMA